MDALELKIPPPVVALIFAVLMWLCPRPAGMVEIAFVVRVVGAVALVLVGQAISVWGIVEFRRAGTTVNPMKASSASTLVSSGVYRFTRNPMYLGLSLSLLGWAVYLWNPLALAVLAAFVLYLTRFQIQPEERILSSLFGEPYLAYLRRVRRWL